MTDASTKPSNPNRRWFQFRLRTLLIAVTLAAGLLVAWRVYVEPYRRQRETMALIKELGREYTTVPGGPAWMRDWFGADNFQDIVLVDLADCDDPEKYIGQVVSLPRLETLVVGGRNFDDEYLSHLERLKALSGLVLDSTDVRDNGIGALKRALPELAIHRSQRRAIAVFEQLEGSVEVQLSGSLPQLRRRVGDEYFKHATSVNLAWSYVSDADLEHLKGFTNLQTLRLDLLDVSDAGLAHITRLTNLRKVWLMYTHVSDAGLAHLKGHTNLRALWLTATKVSDAGLVHLKGLTKLQVLNLEGTQVSDAGVKELQKALPNCDISHD